MARAWIEDLWLTEPKVTLPDGTATRIPVPSAAVKSLAAYMKTPDKAKVPDRFKRPAMARENVGGYRGGELDLMVLKNAAARLLRAD